MSIFAWLVFAFLLILLILQQFPGVVASKIAKVL